MTSSPRLLTYRKEFGRLACLPPLTDTCNLCLISAGPKDREQTSEILTPSQNRPFVPQKHPNHHWPPVVGLLQPEPKEPTVLRLLRVLAVLSVLVALTTDLNAQDEASLRRALEGRRPTVKLDIPAPSEGVHV